jgi:amino acid transporter/ABC-type branched-subunit amino acid transport system substrate-binding protein
MEVATPIQHLRRGLGLRNVISTSTGLAFAALEYPAAASLLGNADPSLAWVAVLAAGVFALIAWGFFAELNGMYPSAATIRLFMNKALNDKVSLTITFAYLSTITLVTGADAYIVGNALTFVLGQQHFMGGLMAIVYIAVLLALAASANLRGVKVAAGLQDVAVYTVIAVTVVIAIIALTHPPSEAAHAYAVTHASQHDIFGFIQAILIGIFLFSAFEWVITNSEEVVKPRHVPIGMLITLGILAVTLSLVVTAMGRLLSGHELTSDYPQLYLGQAALGGVGFVTMLAITGATAINTFNGGFITASRFLYALAREGSLPKPFAALNDKLVPYVPVLVLASLSLVVAVAVQLTRSLHSFAVLVLVGGVFEAMIYMMAGVCVLMLRRREPYRERPFSLPLASIIGWTGVVAFALLTLVASVSGGPDVNGLVPLAVTVGALYGSWWYVSRVVPRLRRKAQAAPRRRPVRGAATGEAVAAADAAIRPKLRRAGPGASASGLVSRSTSMYSRTDRLLAMLFIIQLVAAIVLGAILVQGLRSGNKAGQSVIYVGGTPNPSPSTTGPGTAGSAGTTGSSRTVTTTTGGGAALTARIPPGAPIKIGAIVSETGAINFRASAQGTKAYIDKINSQGGVNGHQIQLELLDDQLDAARGNNEVQQLIGDGVFAFVGFNAPLTENQLRPTVEQHQLPAIGVYGEYDEYHSPYIYAFSGDYPHYGYEMGRYLGLLGSKTPAFVFITNSSSVADASEVMGVCDGLNSTGVTLPGTTNCQTNGQQCCVFVMQPTDRAPYDQAIQTMKLHNPPVDGLITIIDQTAYNYMIPHMNAAQFHPIHVADPLLSDPAVVSANGKQLDGMYLANDYTFIDAGTPEVNDYTQAVKAEFGSDASLNWVGLVGWFDAKVFVDAVRILGSNITRQGLLDVLNSGKIKGDGFTAPWQYSPDPRGGAHPKDVVHDLVRCLQLGKMVNSKVEQAQGFHCDSESTYVP